MSVAEIRRETFYKLTNSADVPERFERVEGVNDNLYIKSTAVKGFLPATGGDSLGGQNAVRKEVTSDFIRVTENEKYVFQGWLTVPDGYAWRAWQYYDADKQPINNRQTPGFNVTTDEDNVSHFQHIITMPANVKYIRISARLYSDGKLKFEKGNIATPYSQAPEDLGWYSTTLVPTQQQRYLWKFEYVYYSDGSVEITQPVNLTKQNAQRTSRDTIHNVRIAIRDSTDAHSIGFFDNVAGIEYKSANLHRFLAGSASILTLKYSSKDIDTIRSGCKLAFRYKNRDYWLNIMDFSKKGYEVEVKAYSAGLELNNEKRGTHKADRAMSFAEYLAYYDPEHSLELGVNEVADKRIKLEWTGTDTILSRLFSIANSFGAELEFTVELNQDYSLKRQILNVYRTGNLGSNRKGKPVRVGKELKVINYSDNIKDLRTAVRATGKDGLTIDGLNKKIYDDNNQLLYYSSGMTVYAPQSRDRYPSVGKKSNDNWIVEDLGETQHETKEALWAYMYSEIQKKSVPQITYDVEGAVDGDVGDTRTLIDDVHYDPPLYVQGRISELTEDLITGKVTKSTLTNFERKYSQVASELLKQVEQLANDAAPYIVRLSTDDGYNFKNGKGTSTITAKLEKYGKIVNANWKWLINNSVVSDKNSVTINASQVIGTLNVVAVATVDGKEVAREYITFTNSDDGVGIKTIKRYYTTNDQADGVTAGGQNWSTKPATVTADNKYLWSYDVITYTNDTSLVTEPAVIGARGNDGLDADTTGVTEALDKAKQELTALSANIEKVRDDSLAAVNETKQQLTTVANELNTAKQDLQNAVSEVDTKATNLQGDLTKAKQDLQAQASQLTAQANAQSELTNRVSSVEETANGTKTTVSELSKTVAQNSKDITSVTARTKTVEDDLLNTKTTLSQVKTTADSTSQKAATLETGLDGLSARFSSLKIGGTNLYIESTASTGFLINDVNNESLGAQGATEKEMTSDFISVTAGEQLVYQGWVTIPSGGGSWRAWQFYGENKKKVGGRYTNSGSAEVGAQHFAHIITVPNDVKYIRISARLYEDGKLKLERGNIATDYSPNEADLELKVADYKQTADQNYASLQSTVQALDGTVTANKATADQTAAGFKTRIESLETYKDGETTRANQYFESAKTETARQLTAERTAIANDYVAKSTYTEDVNGIRNDLTATTTTANTTKTNLASYQASNDRAVASLQSSLQTTDGNVSNLQTQINAVPGQITSAVSAVEGKIPTNLGGRNYLRGTSTEYQTLTSDNYILGYTGNKNISFLDLLEPLKGKTVTIRSYIKNDTDFPVRIQVWFTGGGIHGNLVPAHEEGWSAGTGKILESFASCNVAFTQGGDGTKTGGTIQHKNDKLEIGNVPSDWTPAPEDTASQISNLSSQIQQTADGMTLLATKTELNSAKTDLQSGITTATSKADSAQAAANSNAQTISTHTAQISALNTGLQAKVSQSDFDSLSGRVTTAESNLTATANQLSSQISSVNERIPTSKDFKNLYVIANSSDGFLAYGSTNLGAASPVYRERTSDYIPVEAGEKYTFQIWATLTENQQGWRAWQFYNEDKSLNGGRTAGNYTSDYQCVQQTLTVPAGAKWMRVSARMYSDGKIMVEKGNEYHDYMLAPEDAISDAALTQAKSEIKQTTDTITASVSSVETKADNAQTTANSAVSKANAAQTAVNTLDSEVVKSASLNLDNNGFVTKVGKTIDGNKFATMIAQNANNVKIIADEMQVTADMIVDGAVTAEKLDVNNLSAVNSDLGEIKGGSLLLQENKAAGSATDNWGTYDRPAYKQGLYMDNRAFASSGAIQRKNGGETTPTDMPLAVLQAGELRFLVVDYNDNLKNVVHYGLSDPDFGAIRFEIDSELKRRLTMTSSGYLNFQASNYTNWTSTGVSGCEYMIQGRLVLVNYDVTFSSAGTHTIGSIPQEFTKKSLMMTAKAWTITPRDKNIQLNSDGSLHILDAEANVNYRGTLVFSY